MNSASLAVAFWLRRVAVAACCLACLCLATCAWPGGTAPGGTPASVQAGDDQNGATITLHRGETLMVTLGSTYWSFQGSSNPQVLAPVGAPVSSPAPSGGVPGSGNGTVSQEFRAVGPGTAQVTASRTSCGEALRCGDGAGQYQLTVQVTGTSQ